MSDKLFHRLPKLTKREKITRKPNNHNCSFLFLFLFSTTDALKQQKSDQTQKSISTRSTVETFNSRVFSGRNLSRRRSTVPPVVPSLHTPLALAVAYLADVAAELDFDEPPRRSLSRRPRRNPNHREPQCHRLLIWALGWSPK